MKIIIFFATTIAVVYWAAYFASEPLQLTVGAREVLALAFSLLIIPIYMATQQSRKTLLPGWLTGGVLSVWMGLIYFYILLPILKDDAFYGGGVYGFLLVAAVALLVLGTCTKMLVIVQSRSFPMMMFFVWNFYGVAVVCFAVYLLWLMLGAYGAYGDVIHILFPISIVLSLIVASTLHFLVKSKNFRDFHLNKPFFK